MLSVVGGLVVVDDDDDVVVGVDALVAGRSFKRDVKIAAGDDGDGKLLPLPLLLRLLDLIVLLTVLPTNRELFRFWLKEEGAVVEVVVVATGVVLDG